ncbi:MAG: hypothetical protein GY828_01395 [Candidatus Gracilibacteria bacterium]|nr:hypothetical protein [Candidatus Gracilibacteria bacterium]
MNYDGVTEGYRENDKNILTTTMYIQKDRYPFDADVNIYGNKVSFFSLQDMTGVIIENEKIARSILSLYKATWNAIRHNPENQIYKNQEL